MEPTTASQFGVIYKITNKVNGKIYIGFSLVSLEARWRQHVYNARSKAKSYLYSAMRKHGLENFTVEAIETDIPESEIHAREIFWIAELKSAATKFGYNCTSGGDGARHTESSLSRMRGRKHKPESIERMRQAQKGKKISPEHALKLGSYWRGKTVPVEIVAVRSEAIKKAWTPEKRATWAERMKARWTPEMRIKHGEQMAQRWTPEMRDAVRRPVPKTKNGKLGSNTTAWWDAHPEAKDLLRARVFSEETRRKCAKAAYRGWAMRRAAKEALT